MSGGGTQRSSALRVCVVSHTHWDREWYHGSGYFAQRLVALVDAILALPKSELSASPFLLDGQAIVLADYLMRRPEARAAIGEALREKRIEAGPWFVLADNLIPSGEAIVRNLEAGRRALAQLGAESPRVAYCPDSFGHPAAMPLIVNGFGIDSAVVWRGAGGQTVRSRRLDDLTDAENSNQDPPDAFWWYSPDGSRVLASHLPSDGYEFGSSLPSDAEVAGARWRVFKRLAHKRNFTGVMLVLNGADHHARQPDILAALEALATEAGSDAIVEATTLQEWSSRFLDAVSHCGHDIPEVHGELRDSYGFAWNLSGTLATRAHQKRRNARLERLLLRDVEPWLALSLLHDINGNRKAIDPRGRLTLAQLPSLLANAWERLLSTHPHDTLCGCSVDIVSRSLEAAQDDVEEQGRSLRAAALKLALDHDEVEARERRPPSCGPVVLRNRAGRSRGGLAHITLVEGISDIPVGPGSAIASRSGASSSVKRRVRNPFPKGLCIQFVGDAEQTWERRESPQHYPDNDRVAKQRVLGWVSPIPAMSLQAADPQSFECSIPAEFVRVSETARALRMANGRLEVAVTRSGKVSVAVGDRLFKDALHFETARDAGDSYTPSPGKPKRLKVVSVRMVENGPLRASIEIVASVGSADLANTDGGDVQVFAELRLSVASPKVECAIRVVNRRTNHRLRLVFKHDVVGGKIIADAAYGPVLRPVLTAIDSREAVPDGMPLHRWLLYSGDSRSVALLNDGLAEGFACESRIGVTLLRSIGELSRSMIAERPGHAGWPAAIPDAQCQGVYRARVAFLSLDSVDDPVMERLSRECDDFLLPIVGETWRDLDVHKLPSIISGPRLHGEGLEVSAITVSHSITNAVVLRAVNLLNRAVDGEWHLPDGCQWLVARTRIDETPLEEESLVNGKVIFVAEARSVVTFVIRRREEAHGD